MPAAPTLPRRRWPAYYPRRELGSTEAVGAAAWFAERLDTLNIPYTQTVFEAPLGFERVSMRNIAVVLTGTSTDTIMVTAARDPNLDPQLPPLADASGTGMLLELIQVFAARPHEKTLIFLSSEGGGYAGLGVNEFLEQYDRRERVKVMLSVQGLGKEQTEELLGGVTGPRSTTPGWYVQLVADTLDKVGIRLDLPGLEKQIADQALGLSEGEQVAGLRRGIASLALRDLGGGVVTAAGLATQGSAVERLILALDAGGRTPTDPGTALVLESGRYLTGRALTILGILLLLPIAIMALTWLAVTRMRPDAWLRHLRNLVSFMIPLILLPVLAWLGQVLGLLPRYLFQAPAVPSAATQPRLVPVLALVVLFNALFLLSRHFLGYLRYREPRAMTEMAKLSLGLMTLLVGLGLLATQSPFLLLPWVVGRLDLAARELFSRRGSSHGRMVAAPTLQPASSARGLPDAAGLLPLSCLQHHSGLLERLVVPDGADGLRRLRTAGSSRMGPDRYGVRHAAGGEAAAIDAHRDTRRVRRAFLRPVSSRRAFAGSS